MAAGHGAAGHGALLDAVRGLRWPARRPVNAGPAGVHPSRQRGPSSELAEYRAYRQGDDPRRIDWRLLARADRAYVRLSTDRAVLPTLLVVDASASMAFPHPALDKWRLARDVAIALAAVAHAQGDPVGLACGPRALPPRTRRGVVAEIASLLNATEPAGSAALAPALAATTAQRVVVVSDLLGDDAVLAPARAIGARGGETHVVHVVAREELEPAARAVLAVDPEDDAVRRPLTRDAIGAYAREFAEWRATVAHGWRAAGAGYTMATTDEDAVRVVRRVLDPRVAPA